MGSRSRVGHNEPAIARSVVAISRRRSPLATRVDKTWCWTDALVRPSDCTLTTQSCTTVSMACDSEVADPLAFSSAVVHSAENVGLLTSALNEALELYLLASGRAPMQTPVRLWSISSVRSQGMPPALPARCPFRTWRNRSSRGELTGCDRTTGEMRSLSFSFGFLWEKHVSKQAQTPSWNNHALFGADFLRLDRHATTDT
jgi:hypothetical protein